MCVWANTRHMVLVGALMVGLHWWLDCIDDRFAKMCLFFNDSMKMLMFHWFPQLLGESITQKTVSLDRPPYSYQNHVNMCVWAPTRHIVLVGSLMVGLPWSLDCILRGGSQWCDENTMQNHVFLGIPWKRWYVIGFTSAGIGPQQKVTLDRSSCALKTM